MRLANHRPAAIACLIVLAALPALALAGTSKEYFIDEEIDFIREAQGLSLRVPAILRLANIRLVTLGMKAKSKDDKDLEKKIGEIHNQMEEERTGRTRTRPANKAEDKPADTPAGPYLGDLTRVELLRGYIEALNEIRDYIDESYRQKQSVRKPLGQLEKFCDAAIPLLQRFQSHNAAELQAIDDARMATHDALEGAQDALKKLPKTDDAEKPEKSLQP